MNIVKTYGNYIKKYAGTHPAVSRKMIDIGLHLEQFRTEHFAEKTMPKAYQKLNTLGVKNTLHALEYPESTVWCNLFAPVEIFQCFGLSALSMECLSSFLSGFTCEDYFIDRAESRGIASTLCSYHKDFIGAVDSGIISPARLGVTTSMICDGNINTFRYVSRHTDLDTYVIDVPDSCSPEAVEYVTMQLKELIQKLEAMTGKRLSMDDLSETLARENQSKAYYKEFLKLQAERYYPSTLTLQMYMLFATHLNIGTPETLDLFRSFAEDIKQYPKYDGTRHNAGFEALDYLAAQWQCDIAKAKWQGLYGTAQVNGHKVVLLKPLTYMNLSGQSIAPAANFYKIPADHIIVLCDDITQEPGHLRIRPHGSAGGHNGLKSIIASLGTDHFSRIRIGIGAKPNPQYDLAAWVLGKLPAADRKAMTDRYPDIEEACKLLMDDNLQYAQNKFNH